MTILYQWRGNRITTLSTKRRFTRSGHQISCVGQLSIESSDARKYSVHRAFTRYHSVRGVNTHYGTFSLDILLPCALIATPPPLDIRKGGVRRGIKHHPVEGKP